MFETLVNIDRSLFQFINGMNGAFWDQVMYWVADRFIWIPVYVALAVYLFRLFGKQAVYMVLFAALLIALSDQGSVLVKNTVERERPCHDERLALTVHTVNNKCGGKFGFVSSHAANTMALLVYIFLLTGRHRNRVINLLFVWVLLIGYCRVYMGVHFPADVAGGWIIGIASAFVTYTIYRLIFDKPVQIQKT